LLSADELVDKLKIHLLGGDRFNLDFISYMEAKAAGMKKSTGNTYMNAASALRRFLNRATLGISEINVNLLRNFESFLKKEPSQRGNNRNSGNTLEG
jgi:hypothetical protein